MRRSLLEDAFEHHVWATVTLIDTCLTLSPEQLATEVPGTYGSILETMRHFIGGDSWYLFDITGDRACRIENEEMDLQELRAVIERDGQAWSDVLAKEPDPATIVKEVDETDGYERDASVGIRLAQALHHGTDHRSQICTALTVLGVEPPAIDVWDFAWKDDRLVDIPAPSQ